VGVYAERGLKIPERGMGSAVLRMEAGSARGQPKQGKRNRKGGGVWPGVVILDLDYNLRSPHTLAHTTCHDLLRKQPIRSEDIN
jgi:hypothetical protein